MLGPEVAGGLVQADERFLLDVVGVAADQEVPAALGAGEAAVAVDQGLERLAVALLGASGKFVVGKFAEVPVGEHGDPILWCVEGCDLGLGRLPAPASD